MNTITPKPGPNTDAPATVQQAAANAAADILVPRVIAAAIQASIACPLPAQPDPTTAPAKIAVAAACPWSNLT